jgi:MobA-like NTP transferase domain
VVRGTRDAYLGSFAEMKPVAVLCGGLGTRLGYEGQKCLVPVEGRPFLHWKLDQLIRHGASDIHLLVSYRAEDVWDSVTAREWDAQVRWHVDAGEGKWAAHDRAVDDGLPFVHWVTYGDCLLDVPLKHSLYPYVYVNDEHPCDAGVIYTWGKAKKFLPKHTGARSFHVNTPEDLEVTRASVRRYRVTG